MTSDTASDEIGNPRVPRPVLITLVGLVVVVAIAGLVWPAGTSAGTVAAPDTITVSRDYCGTGWAHPHPGPQTLLLHNADDNSADVDLVSVPGGAVYGEVDGLGPNTTAALRVSLGPGDYAVRCLIDDVDPTTGPAVRITGPGTGNPAAVPVSKGDLLGPVKQYQDYLTAGVAGLVRDTDTLAAAVHAGDLGAARAAWLPAHLDYARLGAAYGALGDLDAKINGPAGGFRQVEFGLWHGRSPAQLAAPADQLDADVHALQAALPGIQTDPLDFTRRAHEIMEDALRFELTGQHDEGSGSNLATVAADLAGDREVVNLLRPLLVTRYPQLSDVDIWSARLAALLQAQRHPDGSWTPVGQLPTADRERLNGTVSELAELLAPIATICEPRRTS